MNIKKERQSRKISRRDLGELVGVSARTVERWEQHLGEPSGAAMKLLKQVFNVKGDD